MYNPRLCFVSKGNLYVSINHVKNPVYKRVKEQNVSNPGDSTSTILVLDWNLDYVATYQLFYYATAFTIDVLTDRIIYAGMNIEGGTDLYYFNVTE